MVVRAISKLVYSVFGALFLIVGATVMLLHTGLMPESLRQIVIGFAHEDELAIHLIQELSSLLVFTGLITFWFVKHYEQSLTFHWSMTAFWALFSFAHWLDGRPGPRSLEGTYHQYDSAAYIPVDRSPPIERKSSLEEI